MKSTYGRQNLRQDLSAGLTVAFVALPQCMAYALIAGVDPQYGLYAFMVGSIVGALFGSSRHLQTGPTNATSIVVASTLAIYLGNDNFMGLVFLLGLLSGFIQLAAGLLRLGNLTQFISRSVLAGFIAGAALWIAANQMPNLLGVPREIHSSVFDELWYVFQNLGNTQLHVLLLGIGTILVALFMNRISPKSSTGIPLLPSYLIAILAAASMVSIFGLDARGVRIVGDISGTLPTFSLPVLNLDVVRTLMPGAIAIALIGFAESTSAAKTVASFAGDKLDLDRDFIGQELAKMFSSFLSGIPVSGSLTRTVLCYRAGAATKFANVFAGILFLLIVLFFSPIVKYIPLAGLAGIVMIIAANMIDWQYVKLAFRSTKSDALAMIATFVSALMLPLDTAIYIGVGLSLALFLRMASTPHIIELNFDEEAGFHELADAKKRSIPELSIVHVEGDIFFGGVDFMEDEIQKIARRDDLKVLILRLKRAFSVDASTIMALKKIHAELKKQNKLLLISGTTKELSEIFHRSGLDHVIGEENILYSGKTILKSTHAAVAHALEYLNREHGRSYEVSMPDTARRDSGQNDE
ncbi:MAG: SulP family inorganic anion transporter [bacterium]